MRSLRPGGGTWRRAKPEKGRRESGEEQPRRRNDRQRTTKERHRRARERSSTRQQARGTETGKSEQRESTERQRRGDGKARETPRAGRDGGGQQQREQGQGQVRSGPSSGPGTLTFPLSRKGTAAPGLDLFCTATAWRSRPENVCSHKLDCWGKSETTHSHKLILAILLTMELRPDCSWKRQWRHRVNTGKCS